MGVPKAQASPKHRATPDFQKYDKFSILHKLTKTLRPWLLPELTGYAESLNYLPCKSITDSPKRTFRAFGTVRVIYAFFMWAANNSVSHYD